MRIYEGLEGCSPDRFRAPVVTLGTFDGVHRGHQAVLGVVTEWAGTHGGESVVLTFRRHPRRIISGKAPSLITSLRRRLALLEEQGVDAAVLIEFTRETASMPPDAFARRILAGRLGARGVVLGYNASFGRGKKGNIALLRDLGPTFGFEVREVPQVVIEGRAGSSSEVRACIRNGDLEIASRLLGRPVTLEGVVVSGRGRGKEIGFPTANLELHHDVKPPAGVYAGRVLFEEGFRPAVINIGTAPTIQEGLPEAIEVHVLDFKGDLYGAEIQVEIAGAIRPEKRFDSIEELVLAIREDIRAAREG